MKRGTIKSDYIAVRNVANLDCSLSLDADDLREQLENLLKRIDCKENNV